MGNDIKSGLLVSRDPASDDSGSFMSHALKNKLRVIHGQGKSSKDLIRESNEAFDEARRLESEENPLGLTRPITSSEQDELNAIKEMKSLSYSPNTMKAGRGYGHVKDALDRGIKDKMYVDGMRDLEKKKIDDLYDKSWEAGREAHRKIETSKDALRSVPNTVTDRLNKVNRILQDALPEGEE